MKSPIKEMAEGLSSRLYDFTLSDEDKIRLKQNSLAVAWVTEGQLSIYCSRNKIYATEAQNHRVFDVDISAKRESGITLYFRDWRLFFQNEINQLKEFERKWCDVFDLNIPSIQDAFATMHVDSSGGILSVSIEDITPSAQFDLVNASGDLVSRGVVFNSMFFSYL